MKGPQLNVQKNKVEFLADTSEYAVAVRSFCATSIVASGVADRLYILEL